VRLSLLTTEQAAAADGGTSRSMLHRSLQHQMAELDNLTTRLRRRLLNPNADNGDDDSHVDDSGGASVGRRLCLLLRRLRLLEFRRASLTAADDGGNSSSNPYTDWIRYPFGRRFRQSATAAAEISSEPAEIKSHRSTVEKICQLYWQRFVRRRLRLPTTIFDDDRRWRRRRLAVPVKPLNDISGMLARCNRTVGKSPTAEEEETEGSPVDRDRDDDAEMMMKNDLRMMMKKTQFRLRLRQWPGVRSRLEARILAASGQWTSVGPGRRLIWTGEPPSCLNSADCLLPSFFVDRLAICCLVLRHSRMVAENAWVAEPGPASQIAVSGFLANVTYFFFRARGSCLRSRSAGFQQLTRQKLPKAPSAGWNAVEPSVDETGWFQVAARLRLLIDAERACFHQSGWPGSTPYSRLGRHNSGEETALNVIAVVSDIVRRRRLVSRLAFATTALIFGAATAVSPITKQAPSGQRPSIRRIEQRASSSSSCPANPAVLSCSKLRLQSCGSRKFVDLVAQIVGIEPLTPLNNGPRQRGREHLLLTLNGCDASELHRETVHIGSTFCRLSAKTHKQLMFVPSRPGAKWKPQPRLQRGVVRVAAAAIDAANNYRLATTTGASRPGQSGMRCASAVRATLIRLLLPTTADRLVWLLCPNCPGQGLGGTEEFSLDPTANTFDNSQHPAEPPRCACLCLHLTDPEAELLAFVWDAEVCCFAKPVAYDNQEDYNSSNINAERLDLVCGGPATDGCWEAGPATEDLVERRAQQTEDSGRAAATDDLRGGPATEKSGKGGPRTEIWRRNPSNIGANNNGDTDFQESSPSNTAREFSRTRRPPPIRTISGVHRVNYPRPRPAPGGTAPPYKQRPVWPWPGLTPSVEIYSGAGAILLDRRATRLLLKIWVEGLCWSEWRLFCTGLERIRCYEMTGQLRCPALRQQPHRRQWCIAGQSRPATPATAWLLWKRGRTICVLRRTLGPPIWAECVSGLASRRPVGQLDSFGRRPLRALAAGSVNCIFLGGCPGRPGARPLDECRWRVGRRMRHPGHCRCYSSATHWVRRLGRLRHNLGLGISGPRSELFHKSPGRVLAFGATRDRQSLLCCRSLLTTVQAVTQLRIPPIPTTVAAGAARLPWPRWPGQPESCRAMTCARTVCCSKRHRHRRHQLAVGAIRTGQPACQHTSTRAVGKNRRRRCQNSPRGPDVRASAGRLDSLLLPRPLALMRNSDRSVCTALATPTGQRGATDWPASRAAVTRCPLSAEPRLLFGAAAARRPGAGWFIPMQRNCDCLNWLTSLSIWCRCRLLPILAFGLSGCRFRKAADQPAFVRSASLRPATSLCLGRDRQLRCLSSATALCPLAPRGPALPTRRRDGPPLAGRDRLAALGTHEGHVLVYGLPDCGQLAQLGPRRRCCSQQRWQCILSKRKLPECIIWAISCTPVYASPGKVLLANDRFLVSISLCYRTVPSANIFRLDAPTVYRKPPATAAEDAKQLPVEGDAGQQQTEPSTEASSKKSHRQSQSHAKADLENASIPPAAPADTDSQPVAEKKITQESQPPSTAPPASTALTPAQSRRRRRRQVSVSEAGDDRPNSLSNCPPANPRPWPVCSGFQFLLGLCQVSKARPVPSQPAAEDYLAMLQAGPRFRKRFRRLITE
uniref:Phosphodiesterase I n=1 Tax=Macrostomum lignano TaxID=282301 RepID=A0A1I8FNP6_9PLAT